MAINALANTNANPTSEEIQEFLLSSDSLKAIVFAAGEMTNSQVILEINGVDTAVNFINLASDGSQNDDYIEKLANIIALSK